MPVAVTEKDAVWPTATVWLAGCAVIEGTAEAEVTVSTAALLLALPTELLTNTMNFAPLSAFVVAGVT